MKNLFQILTIVLLVAVAYLLFSHFSHHRGGADAAVTGDAIANTGGLSIVYINSDTLLTHYDYYKEQATLLEQKGKDADAAMQARTRALEREFRTAQEKVQTGTMTPKQVQSEEQRLVQKQQSLMAEQERLGQSLMAEQQKLQEDLQTRIKSLLKDLQKEKGYDYILNYGPGSGVLMVDESLDITREVLKRLNEKPAAEEKQ